MMTSTGDYTGEKYQGFHDGMLKAGLSITVDKSIHDPAGRAILVPVDIQCRPGI